jgi:hypothetical protein
MEVAPDATPGAPLEIDVVGASLSPGFGLFTGKITIKGFVKVNGIIKVKVSLKGWVKDLVTVATSTWSWASS